MEEDAVHERIAEPELAATRVVDHRADDIDAHRCDAPADEEIASKGEDEPEAVLLDLEPPRQPATVDERDQKECRRELNPMAPVDDVHEDGHEEKELRAPSQVAARTFVPA